MDDPAKPRAGLRDELPPDPRPGDVTSVLEEVAKLYCAVFEVKGHYYIESTALLCSEGGLDDAARSGNIT